MNILNVWQRDFLLSIVRLVAGAYPVWHQAPPSPTQKICFSNHTSHIDTLAILAALPRNVRAVVRPVAARDYWDSSDMKRHIAQKLLNVVLIDRHRESGGDPLDPVREALKQGHSIIIFPEGTRGSRSCRSRSRAGCSTSRPSFRTSRSRPSISRTCSGSCRRARSGRCR